MKPVTASHLKVRSLVLNFVAWVVPILTLSYPGLTETPASEGAATVAAYSSEGSHKIRLCLKADETACISSFAWCGAYLVTILPGSDFPQAPRSVCQVLVLQPAGEIVVALTAGSTLDLHVEFAGLQVPAVYFWTETVLALDGERYPLPNIFVSSPPVDGQQENETESAHSRRAGQVITEVSRDGDRIQHRVDLSGVSDGPRIGATLRLSADKGPAALRLGGWRVDQNFGATEIEFFPGPAVESLPPPSLPQYLPPIEAALVEWDWRLQDGIGTPREAVSYSVAVARLLTQAEALINHQILSSTASESIRQEMGQSRAFRDRLFAMQADPGATETQYRALWAEVHRWRRRLLLRTVLPAGMPIAFVKHIPSAFSHQLTQYYGRDARPGGGVFLLSEPGQSMATVDLIAGRLPTGSYQHLDLSPEAGRLVFAFCAVDKPPPNREAHGDRFFQLFELDLRTNQLRQLTCGNFDHFAPRYLPDGKIICVSSRRGGFHRCGRGPCPVYTLTIVEKDGTAKVVSFHETHEWDPAVLPDGRIIYTRWDYVDRHAVFYQQLWTSRADGTNVQAYYGNGTFNPVGIWEAVPVPGTDRVMATAAAHHAMTAGSIILLDVRKGRDGLGPIERLTPDAPFPESEFPVVREPGGHWFAAVGPGQRRELPEQARRWPGHSYRTPFPICEDYFLAAYSYDPLIGEPTANRPNMFALYALDRFGNKELIYRDLNHCSLWPVVMQLRPAPPLVASILKDHHLTASTRTSEPNQREPGERSNHFVSLASSSPARAEAASQTGARAEGIFFLQNVYEAWPPLPEVRITRLRIVQVLPKSTPHINTPPVGLANASPGKQVLGTVPVEADGSAFFVAPAGIPLAFQALDERGQAVQIMRSLTYLQPGEVCSCIGCHEPRHTAPRSGKFPLALRRPPSTITPGPTGSRPLSFPLLVQPILDRHCVRCHNDTQAEGGVNLVGRPAQQFTVSYLALAPRVRFSAWDGGPNFTETNCEPYTRPGFFGARGSPLMKLVLEGHGGVTLSAEEIEALATWMDTNALFYGTFDPADQARQLRGELIAGPAVE